MGKYYVVGQRLIALFVVGWLLFNYPLLSLFSDGRTLGGVPLLYVFLFAAWTALIVAIALVVERTR